MGSRSRTHFGIWKPEVQTSSALSLEYYGSRSMTLAELRRSHFSTTPWAETAEALAKSADDKEVQQTVRDTHSRTRASQEHTKKHLRRDSTWTDWASDVSRAGNLLRKHEPRNISAVEHLSRWLLVSDGYRISKCSVFVWIRTQTFNLNNSASNQARREKCKLSNVPVCTFIIGIVCLVRSQPRPL